MEKHLNPCQVSYLIGHSRSYIGCAFSSGRLGIEVIKQLELTYGIDPNLYVLDTQEISNMLDSDSMVVNINGVKLREILYRKELQIYLVSIEIGQCGSYVSDCIRRSRMRISAIRKLNSFYDIAPEEFVTDVKMYKMLEGNTETGYFPEKIPSIPTEKVNVNKDKLEIKVTLDISQLEEIIEKAVTKAFNNL